MPRKPKESHNLTGGINGYLYSVMLIFFAGLAVIIYTVVDGIVGAMGLPGYMGTMFRGTTVLIYLVMGLIFLYPIISN